MFTLPEPIPVDGLHVKIATLGDERRAVVEVVTGEPVQYLAEGSNAKKLIERWDAVIEGAVMKSRGA